MELGSAAEWAEAAVAACGFLAAWRQLRRSANAQRAQFLLESTQRYFGDPDVRMLYYDLDYDRLTLKFDDGQPSKLIRKGSSEPEIDFRGSNEERHLDSLLYSLDIIGRMVELQMMTADDAMIFAFQARRVFKNRAVEEYLSWLDGERESFGGERPPFRAARLLAGLAQ